MEEIRACGVIVFSREPRSFLLMKHEDRWDFPKGHLDPGETDRECAIRELEEETGIRADDIEIDEQFRFEISYTVRSKRFNHQPRTKSVRYYLAWIVHPCDIVLTEHIGAEWIPWNPPHRIQEQTVDPLLAAVAEYWDRSE